jgi:DNA-binding response OmpR family regulator
VDVASHERWLVAGPLRIRADAAEAFVHDEPVRLTDAQRSVLAALVRREGRLARRPDLYEEAFGRPLPPRSRAVDIHVGRIRSALGAHGDLIVTIGRVGYRIDAPAQITERNNTQRRG